jgi:aryl-alcohol dehydrogenase-like predicted oxidoreductase
MNRRAFFGLGGAARVAAEVDPPRASSGPVPRRPLGKTGLSVSVLALGGWHLGAARDDREATRIVAEAIDAGINFCDNAWEYHDGKSEERLGKAIAGKRDAIVLMTKVCTHGRGADVAMKQLEESLRRLGTDHLDLWQVHECIYETDPDLVYMPDGVLSALDRAKQQGKVRFVGFTGHKDPSVHLRMLERGYPFDTVQMPLSCFDGSFRSFEEELLPKVVARRIAPIGMKSLGGAGDPILAGVVTADEAIRYTLSLPIASLVSGIESIDVLRQNLAIVRDFVPMSAAEMQALRARLAPLAADGRFELYKTTMRYDAKVGREQHGLPSAEQVPL